MKVIIRAFNKDCYHRDIVLMDDKQVYMHDRRVKEDPTMSLMSGLIGVGVGIAPEDFPEIVRFEVVIKDSHG